MTTTKTDIVKRLRAVGGESWNNPARIRNEAANEIEQLRAELDALRTKVEAMKKSVPEKVEVREDEGHIFSRGSYNEGYDNGWNDCIETMLAAAPETKP